MPSLTYGSRKGTFVSLCSRRGSGDCARRGVPRFPRPDPLSGMPREDMIRAARVRFRPPSGRDGPCRSPPPSPCQPAHRVLRSLLPAPPRDEYPCPGHGRKPPTQSCNREMEGDKRPGPLIRDWVPLSISCACPEALAQESESPYQRTGRMYARCSGEIL